MNVVNIYVCITCFFINNSQFFVFTEIEIYILSIYLFIMSLFYLLGEPIVIDALIVVFITFGRNSLCQSTSCHLCLFNFLSKVRRLMLLCNSLFQYIAYFIVYFTKFFFIISWSSLDNLVRRIFCQEITLIG